jgi:hypothetical protein
MIVSAKAGTTEPITAPRLKPNTPVRTIEGMRMVSFLWFRGAHCRPIRVKLRILDAVYNRRGALSGFQHSQTIPRRRRWARKR